MILSGYQLIFSLPSIEPLLSFLYMPLLCLVTPPPDARLPDKFEDREAQARLKLHLMMARLRATLRAVMASDDTMSIPEWRTLLQDELVRQPFQ